MDDKPEYDDLKTKCYELKEKIKTLEIQIAEKQRSEDIDRTLIKIANSVYTTSNLKELYATIYDYLDELMDLPNLYIAQYDKKQKLIYFPFYVDEYDNHEDSLVEDITKEHTLTSEVILAEKPLFLTWEMLLKREEENRIRGTVPKIWIGVPLKISDEVIGVLAVQSYTEPEYFTKEDLKILIFIADQIAFAIERRQILDDLQESREQLMSIFKAIPDPVVLYNMRGFPIYLNHAFKKKFGWTLEDLQNKTIPFVPEDQKEITFAKIKELYRYEKPVRMETKRLTRNNEIFDIYLNAAVVKNKDGKLAGMVVQLIDITEKNRLEKQLRQAQKMESVGVLAGGVAHDFNNLLTVINGRADIALLGMDETSSLYKHLNEIKKAGKRAENLTRQLLAFSRKQIYQPKVVDLNKIIFQLNKMFQRLISENIKIKLHIDDDIPPIKADSVQIEQILINLVVNARDAIMEKSGYDSEMEISIETGRVVIDDESVEKRPGAKKGRYVFFSVSDTGTGMDDKTRDNIFEPFFTTKPEGIGTGLGLATVYGIVKQNNGFVYVDSELTRGSSFKVYWPISDTEEQIFEAGPDGSSSILKGDETILIAEDNEGLRLFAKEALVKMGYRVYEAANGKKAVELEKFMRIKEKIKIDLLLTDIIMPEMGGRELADLLMKENPDLRVLFTSGYTDNQIVHNGKLQSKLNFIQKPFTIQTLSEKIRQVLENKAK